MKKSMLATVLLLSAAVGGTWLACQWLAPVYEPYRYGYSVAVTCGGGDYSKETFRIVNDELPAKLDALLGDHASLHHLAVVPKEGDLCSIDSIAVIKALGNGDRSTTVNWHRIPPPWIAHSGSAPRSAAAFLGSWWTSAAAARAMTENGVAVATTGTARIAASSRPATTAASSAMDACGRGKALEVVRSSSAASARLN